MSEHVRRSRRRRRRPAAPGFPAAGPAVPPALVSVMYWTDDLVAEYVTRPELPGRDAVIDRATDLRAASRRLAAELRRSGGPVPGSGNVLRFLPSGGGFRRADGPPALRRRR